MILAAPVSPPRPAISLTQLLTGCYLLALLVLLAYANVYNNDFVYDDDILIVKNQFLRSFHDIPAIFSSSATGGANIPGGFWRPLQILAYLAIYQLWGLSVLPYHLLNVGLHALNAGLVFALGIRLGFRPLPVLLAAAIWALHPVDVEAVTYISATADPLYACLCLAGVLVSLPDFSARRIAASSACFIFALLAKETGIVFPLLVMNCIWLRSPQRWHWRSYLCTWPLWIIALAYAAFRVFWMNFDDFVLYTRHDAYADDPGVRIVTFLATLPNYVRLLAWPKGLHLDRNFPVYTDALDSEVLLGGLLILLAAAQIVICKGRAGRAFGWGLLWFFAAHLMHTGILKPLNSLFLEHWMYLPCVGLYLGAAEGIGEMLAGNRRWLAAIAAAVTIAAALALGCATYRQNTTWYDSEALYKNIFDNGETSAHAFTNLGVLYTKQGKYEKALEQYRYAFASAHDQDAQPHHNYAITVLMQGNDDAHVNEAIAHFKRALAIDPSFFPSAKALADIYGKRGDAAQAATYRRIAEQAHEKLAPHSGALEPQP